MGEDGVMPLLPSLGRAVGTGLRGGRLLLRGSVRSGRWVGRRVVTARTKGAAGETGMVRLFDLHAASCAGDTLIAIGLAGTIFFNVPLGEARSKVALYLLVTMVPFALLAPVVGPLLDHFRHGRRYALAATMLGRAFLAWMISDYIHGFGLYPAAFGVLALSRAYGVARSAAVPRLLPAGLGLSQAGARASVYGTFAGAVVAPLGLAAFWFGPQWPLRVASLIFLVGMVIALRLPPRADSDPPETVPGPITDILGFGRGRGERPLSGRLVVATLVGSATLRAVYGFLLLYLAFAIKGDKLSTIVLGRDVGDQGAVALVGGALAVGTFIATAVGTRLRIRRPAALQSSGLTIVAGVAVLATVFASLAMVTLLCLLTAIFSGISKLAIDASIQERIDERQRASAFAHSETVLMLAWVTGGAVGIIPMQGRVGLGVAAGFAVLAAIRAAIVAGRLHRDRLHGRPDGPPPAAEPVPTADPAPAGQAPAGQAPAGQAPTAEPAPTGQAAAAPTSSIRPSTTTPATGPVPASRPATTTGNETATGKDVATRHDIANGDDGAPLAPPGFHIYRPSSSLPDSGNGVDEGGSRHGSAGPPG
jgi:hypothetical protein